MNKIDKIIDWFRQRKGKVTYSMEHREGTASYDCSSSVFFAVCNALGIEDDDIRNTSNLGRFLLQHGFEKVTENKEWTAKKGDIIIWAKRKGVPGASAHTGVFTDNSHIIHCNFKANGISENTEKYLLPLYDWNYEVYRLNEVEKTGWQQEEETNKWWYKNQDGSYPHNEWKKIGDNWFYFDENGYAYQEKWLKYKNEWYYFDKDCYMVHDKWITIGEETFYFNDWGVCDLNYVRTIDGKQYAFNERGALIKNKIIEENGSIENLKK